jgi:hypothetical protein
MVDILANALQCDTYVFKQRALVKLIKDARALITCIDTSSLLLLPLSSL